jgi:hypothetical protein
MPEGTPRDSSASADVFATDCAKSPDRTILERPVNIPEHVVRDLPDLIAQAAAQPRRDATRPPASHSSRTDRSD